MGAGAPTAPWLLRKLSPRQQGLQRPEDPHQPWPHQGLSSALSQVLLDAKASACLYCV